MGKKKPVQKPTTTKPSSPQTVQQQQPPPPVIQRGAVISLDSLADFLRRSNRAVDWTTTLAALTQIGGTTPVVSVSPTIIVPPPATKPSEISTETEPSATTKPSEIPIKTEPSDSTKPSPTQTQTEPLDVSPLSAYRDPVTREESAKGEETPEEQGNGEEENRDEGGEKEEETGEEGGEKQEGEGEETPGSGAASERDTFEGVDLNETARKQGLMTDEEFQAILDVVTGRGATAAETAEGLDLASEAVDELSTRKPIEDQEEETTQSVGGVVSEKKSDPDPEIPVVQSEVVKSTGVKAKAVKRKLVLKDDPQARDRSQAVFRRGA